MKTYHIIILAAVGLVIAGAVYMSGSGHKKKCSCGEGTTSAASDTATE